MDLTGPEGNSIEEMATSPVPPACDHKPEFLFIHTTSDSRSYKYKDRQDIRSHVRRVASKRAKAHFGQRLRNQVVAPGPLSQYLPKLCPNGGKYPLHISSNSGQTLHQDRGILNSEVSETNEVGKQYMLYCNMCEGQRMAGHDCHKPKVEKASRAMCRDLWRTSDSSPVGILGAGRQDPFSSLPIVNPNGKDHELIDHAKHYLLADLIPDERPSNISGANAASKAWFRFGIQSPLVLHALVFASSVHLDFLRWSKIFPNSPHALSHKLTVMQKVKELIAKDSQFAGEDLIVAILILACHEDMDTSPMIEADGKRWPFHSPLGRGKWMNMYTGVRIVPEHMKAVVDLVNLRGGLEKIKLYGLADVIVAGEVKVAVGAFSKPTLPQLQRHKTHIASLLAWATSLPRAPAALGFRNFQDLGITDILLQNLESVGAYSIALDHYHKGKPGGLSLAAIARTRWAIQQQLLLLSPAEELEKISFSNLCFYECCRLTLHIFGLAVVFIATSDAHAHLQTLVTRLKTWVEMLYIHGYGTDSAHLLLWMLTLGGIAAADKPERPWFASHLAIIVHRLNITWDDAKEILETFLWLESVCDSGGRDVWSEAIDSSLL